MVAPKPPSSPAPTARTVPLPPSSPVVAPATARSSKFIRRTARMSTGGRKPDKHGRKDGQRHLNFPTKAEVARKGRVCALIIFSMFLRDSLVFPRSILQRLRVLRRPLRAYQLGTAQKYLSTFFHLPPLHTLTFSVDNGVDTAYVESSWIEHPDADFKPDTVTMFLNDIGLSAYRANFTEMGVVSGDDLLNLCLEARNQVIRLKVKDALGLDGQEWREFRVKIGAFARQVVCVIED